MSRSRLWDLRDFVQDKYFDPRIRDHVRWFLYERLKLPKVAVTTRGVPRTDKTTMVLLALHADTPEQKAGLIKLVRYLYGDKR